MPLPPEYDGPRTPRPEEWDSVIELMRSVFFKERGPWQLTMRPWPLAFRGDIRENTLAIYCQGEPVSAISRLERDILTRGHTLRLGFIGSVCTHTEHRGKGLASAVLAATLQRFRESGVDFMYISGTRPLYFGAGANWVGLEAHCALDGAALPGDPRVRTRQAGLDDIAALAELAGREGTRFLRHWEDWRLVLEHGHCSGFPCAIHLVERDRALVGYLVLRDIERDNLARVIELAGDRSCLLAALASLRPTLGERRLDLFAPHGDPIVDLLAVCGVGADIPKNRGTIKAVDPQRTLAKLAPYFRERRPDGGDRPLRLTSHDGAYTLTDGENELELADEAQLLWLLVGRPPDAPGELPQATGRLRDAVETCLPLSLPLPYINMI